MNHCKIENYDCPNVPDGETCVCVGCGNLYFRKTDEGCYCDEPCQAFWDMMDRNQKQKTEKWRLHLTSLDGKQHKNNIHESQVQLIDQFKDCYPEE